MNGFGKRAIRPPSRDVQWLTEEDMWRLINIGLSLSIAFAIGLLVGVMWFRSLPL